MILLECKKCGVTEKSPTKSNDSCNSCGDLSFGQLQEVEVDFESIFYNLSSMQKMLVALALVEIQTKLEITSEVVNEFEEGPTKEKMVDWKKNGDRMIAFINKLDQR